MISCHQQCVHYHIQGTVSAVRLVRMSPEEMAPKQLQEERRKLEEKSLKMSVLPEGTSFINYVTRREELVQRDEGRTRTPPPRGVGVFECYCCDANLHVY